jgi:hypothetical protein
MSPEDIPHLTDERSGTVGSSGRNLANAVQLENLNFFLWDRKLFCFRLFHLFSPFPPFFLHVRVEKSFVYVHRWTLRVDVTSITHLRLHALMFKDLHFF